MILTGWAVPLSKIGKILNHGKVPSRFVPQQVIPWHTYKAHIETRQYFCLNLNINYSDVTPKMILKEHHWK